MSSAPTSYLPKNESAVAKKRQRVGRVWQGFFFLSIVFALVALMLLLYNITREAFGVVAEKYTNDPDTLAEIYLGYEKPFDELDSDELSIIASMKFQNENNEARLRILVMDWVLGVTRSEPERLKLIGTRAVSELLEEGTYPEEIADKPIGIPPLTAEEYQQIMSRNLSDEQLRDFVLAEVALMRVVRSWPMNEVILNYDGIEAELERANKIAAGEIEAGKTEQGLEVIAGSELRFRSWVNFDFLSQPMNTRPELAGIRTAIFGSLWVITLTILFAFPLGVGAAIYLEEYAEPSKINSIIQTNIYNLAGVPSIVYGILGLAVFARALEGFTSGRYLASGVDTLGLGIHIPTAPEGRTVIAASMTMALLILPLIIINAQEAIRSVPNSIRQASYGLGATKWQTTWNHVLPYALPGIFTGTILSVSRAIGETAPLIVVGAVSYITKNPESPFSRFTVLPIQIYRWTSRPEKEFQNAAAAAIVVLMVILLSMNSFAIILRNHFSRR